MNRCAQYEAFIPPEPLGLEVVRDREGDIWQRRVVPSDALGSWQCIRPKVGGMFGGSPYAHWRTVVVNYGPIVPLVWSDAAESEQSGAPDTGQPDHPVG